MKSSECASGNEREVWDKLWERHETSFSEKLESQWDLFDRVKWEYLETLLPKAGRVLECGCGSARMSVYAAKTGLSAVLLDYSEEALRVARNNFRKEGLEGVFVNADVNKLPFPDESFDVVMSHGLMEHLKDIRTPMREMARVLKKGGLLYADIAPQRLSIQTLGDFFNFSAKFTYHLIHLNFGKMRRDFKILMPEYYDNGLSWMDYKKAMLDLGLRDVVVMGDRPFPHLILPKFLERLYIHFMEKFFWFWKKFDGSMPALYLGVGWWAYGLK